MKCFCKVFRQFLTHRRVISNFQNQLSFRWFPFHAISRLVAHDCRIGKTYFLIQLTLSGDSLYSASAASWNSCQEWMYTIAHRCSGHTKVQAAADQSHNHGPMPILSIRWQVRPIQTGFYNSWWSTTTKRLQTSYSTPPQWIPTTNQNVSTLSPL